MKIPHSLQTVLWSYDLDKLEPDNSKDKKLIITQVLNFGTFVKVRWLFKHYPAREIRKVLRHPSRGVWLKKRLDYWLKIFEINLGEDIYEKAILNLRPQIKRG